jgi:hypothetical protein
MDRLVSIALLDLAGFGFLVERIRCVNGDLVSFKTCYFSTMNKWILFAILPLLMTSCFRWGAEAKYLKFRDHGMVDDGNNSDSAFFMVTYENLGEYPVTTPYLRVVVKDTTSGIFKRILFSEGANYATIPAHQQMTYYIYAKNFQLTDRAGKIKFFISWENYKGKNSGRRSTRQL